MQFRIPHTFSLEQHPKRTFLLVSTVVLLALYWPSFASPFVYDDLDQILNNPNLGSWNDFAHRFLLHPVALTTSFFGYGGTTYRPLFWLSLFLDHAAWGINAAGFHGTNVTLHLLNGNLFFAFLRRVRFPVLLAFLASLLWLTLPIDTEVVAWISGRAYLICSTFVLLALLAALAYMRRGGVVSAFLCFAMSGCALLSHELGVIVLPLLVATSFVGKQEWSKHFFGAVGLIALADLCIEGLRISLGVKGFPAMFSLRWAALSVWQYVSLTLFPVHMSLERSTTIDLNHTHPLLAVELLSVAVVLGYAITRRKQNSALLTGLLWFGLCIAPFCIAMNYQGIAERFAYLAAAGLALAVATAFVDANNTSARRALISCLVLWSAWNLYRTSSRVEDWADPVRLYQNSLAATPLSPLIHYNLAFSLREQGSLQEALKEYQQTTELNPAYPHGYASLGDVYLKLDQYDLAQAAYKNALGQNPKDTAVLLNSGAAFQGAGQKVAAEITYLRILQIDPSSSPAHVNLGVLYQSENRIADASRHFSTAIDLKTSDIVPFYDLGVILQQAGRADLALVLYKKVLEIKPDDEDTLRNIQIIQRRGSF